MSKYFVDVKRVNSSSKRRYMSYVDQTEVKLLKERLHVNKLLSSPTIKLSLFVRNKLILKVNVLELNMNILVEQGQALLLHWNKSI